MDPDFEIEDVNEYGVPQTTASNGYGVVFKILVGLIFIALYFLVSRFSAAFGTRLARLATDTHQRNYDVEMREARRRLQERFDNERRNRKTQNNGNIPTEDTEKSKSKADPQKSTKRIKAPNPETLNSSGYFPLIGDSSGSNVCFRRSRKPGG
ncbi:unnamed protein product [Hydatigera taeniaeformis]|uniref:Selenoprotein S n=1 Tax=Hydatigena taeniaeformis TaxID=6205 RepID=A0A0R3X499_HYDTA|nr:unnamed protein product [Hydatigera taeniaeformis]